METKQDCFVGWIRSHGGYLHPDLDLFAPLPGGDRGVVTRAAIKEGEQLVRVPLDICLHMPTDAEWASSQVSNAGHFGSARALLSLYIMRPNTKRQRGVFLSGGRRSKR